MNSHWHQQLAELSESQPELLRGICRGIEKESLRVAGDGVLAQTPHPDVLGSALTHGSITTDYSESLMEFITPVSSSIDDTLRTLEDVHSFVYKHIGSERLWSASMPCIVAGDAGIPVARYGSSNVGRMKTVYRYGLGNRYGRLMQAIAGVHYNFSMPDSYWPEAQKADDDEGPLQDYITSRYLGLIRNFHRWSWLLIYLFGASPAVCASFMRGRGEHHLEPFDGEGNSLHLPHATALRMGDLGYNSSAQKSLRACYNSLDNYIATLTQAILTPHPDYAAFKGKQDDEYMQLNDSLLQIENEFYSTIRPKRPGSSGETPLSALHERGIEYVEVRCIDVSPFHPLGIDGAQIRLLDSFLLFCLTQPSPPCDEAQQDRQASNLTAVVNRGREPGLMLDTESGPRLLTDWAEGLLSEIAASAELLDTVHGNSDYAAALAEQHSKVRGDVELPSARVLREMRETGMPYYRFAMGYSNRWAEHFKDGGIDAAAEQSLIEESTESLSRQTDIEAADDVSFEDYLAAYFDQYKVLNHGD
ncbi:glutamate--cysteine ligase [Congregibacter brevis]|uniref:Glutamate--cysteine ligase n=1 Tax=Congregibacter brevis TaxID=3081201 RepID=A0ABZ0IGQ7_9GAMM|nr:glutamate--cysteine ligase [Congregibacter sp. IMCC45268]